MEMENDPEGKPLRIRRSRLKEILEEYKTMHDLLRSWPAREILMDYEKDWDQKRIDFLRKKIAPPALDELE